MRIAIYEYFTATGAHHTSVWVEGNSMLKAAVEDLSRAGYEVHVTDSIPPKKPADLVLIIAPSSGRTLYNLVKACEDEGLDVMDSPSTAIFLATDKALMAKNLELHGIRTAKTMISRLEDGLRDIEQALLNYGRVVVKPADGDGCIGLSLVSSLDEALLALNTLRQSTKLPYFLIQEYVEGLNLSVCLLALNDEVLPLSINMQKVHLKGPRETSSYYGSVVPYEDNERVLQEAVRAVRSLGHVRGFFGVDVVLKDGEPYVIEVNPRLTTSYLALREVSEENVLGMLVNAYFGKHPLKPIKLRGRAVVEKLIAEKDTILSSTDLKLPTGAKLLSSVIGKRYLVKKGETYGLYVHVIER
ncbi:MAG: ATP-grasp domain-containing protein [Candidatus Nezhaarchaeales archaeon]